MSIVYATKSEKKYLGALFGDSAPSLKIEYQDHIGISKVSIANFKSWFGITNINDVGMLREFNEYVNQNSYEEIKQILSVSSSDTVNDNTIIIDSKFKFFKNTIVFKCLPVSQPINTMKYINIFLTSDKKVTVSKEQVIPIIMNEIINLVVTRLYNNTIFTIAVSNQVLGVKIQNISTIGIISDSTQLSIKTSSLVTLKYIDFENIIDIPVKKLELLPVVNEAIPVTEIKQMKLSVDFSKLKIGGLRKQLEEIANVIRPRGIDQEHLDKIGMDEFEKGIILHGPPGSGKTTIARELASVLGVKQFQIVNGPELLNKYVGESEANIRNILKNYSKDLKIVFFDEFDCLGKERTGDSSTGSSVANNIVNQILSIMDGVEQSNNLLIIVNIVFSVNITITVVNKPRGHIIYSIGYIINLGACKNDII